MVNDKLSKFKQDSTIACKDYNTWIYTILSMEMESNCKHLLPLVIRWFFQKKFYQAKFGC